MSNSASRIARLTALFEHSLLRRYAQIIYAAILIILIPLAIIGNTVYIINQFRGTINTHLQRQALIIAELINATVVRSTEDIAAAQPAIDRIIRETQELSSLDILIPDGDSFRIVASSVPGNIETIVSGVTMSLAWHDTGSGIAHLSQPSAEDIRNNPRLTRERYWNVVAPLSDAEGNRFALLNLKMSLGITDALMRQTLIASYILLSVTILIVGLLLLANTHLFVYAVLFKKLKEVDEMKDEFISMASHELRTPITVMSGYLEMFRDGSFGKLTTAGEKGMTILQTSAHRLATLVDDLLNVSRIEQGRLQLSIQPLDPTPVIQETIAEMKIDAEKKKLLISFQCPEPLPPITADRDRFKQILVNLISNAIKYTVHGSVLVRARVGESDISIDVEDTGIGINPTDTAKLFDKFFRVKNELTKGVTGTGLGLWITRRLVELLGGTISLNSLEGKGTVVSFTVPRAPHSDRSTTAQ